MQRRLLFSGLPTISGCFVLFKKPLTVCIVKSCMTSVKEALATSICCPLYPMLFKPSFRALVFCKLQQHPLARKDLSQASPLGACEQIYSCGQSTAFSWVDLGGNFNAVEMSAFVCSATTTDLHYGCCTVEELLLFPASVPPVVAGGLVQHNLPAVRPRLLCPNSADT